LKVEMNNRDQGVDHGAGRWLSRALGHDDAPAWNESPTTVAPATQDEVLMKPRHAFMAAPPTVPTIVAAVLDPTLAALLLVVMHALFEQPFDGPSRALVLLLLVMMFPGVNRFKTRGWALGLNIASSWAGVVAVLWLFGLGTNSLEAFDTAMLQAWIVAVPVAQWGLVGAGGALLRRRARSREFRRASVIVGATRMGARVADILRQRDGRELLGFFDDRGADRVTLLPATELLGRLEELPAFIESRGVKDAYITLPLTSQPRMLKLLESLQNTTASLHFVPDVFDVKIIQGRLEDMDGVPVVGLLASPFTGINSLLKRLSDVTLATLILVLIAPVLLAVAWGVRRSSPGPIIFRQRRTGLDGEVIEVYKFRSMTTQDNGAVVAQATRHDPRITPFGAFIRRTSLDELPQFFNVLQGTMSIVGPRPHAVAHNDQYRKIVKSYMARHKVKPGITGWAQVNGLRGETDTVDKMARRVEYDLEYLRNWSLALDLMIIARTARQMFFDRKAY
jgi:putative colanic acid biosysnthesis UDP-glucose lipid carrier transferase